MERQHLLRRTAVFLLSLCLLSTTLLGILPVPASAETVVTTVYYLDSEGWGSVSAYVYGDNGEVLGGWPGTAATADGGSWVKTTVTAANAFSVIFNGSGGQSADIYIGTVGGTYYVTKDGTHHASKEAAEAYMNPTPVTTVYYLDSEGWGSISAYVYGDNGEVLGGWPGTAATADGGSWVKTTVTAANAFSVIFNGSGGQSADIYIGTVGGTYYVTKDGTHHASKEAAEEYMNPTEPEKVPTDIYFLNSDNWSGVGAYVYGDKGELLGSWGTTTATADSDSWVKVTVPDAPPFSIVFYNTSDDNQRAELYLGDASNVYVTVNSVAFVSKADAEASVAPAEPEKVPTDIYFLNSNNWAGVGAYIYGDKGELLGSWGTTTATADDGNWVKVTAPDAPPFSIVFYNTADDSQRAELLLSDATNVYVTVNAAAFASKSAAEASVAPAEPEKVPTDIYFLNSNDWAGVGAYVYGDKGELLGSWGTTTATADSGSWVKVTAPDAPPFSIVFYNTSDDSQRAELYLGDAANVYVTVNAAAFVSKEAAEASIAPVEPEPAETYDLYFLNSNGWETVGAYIYGDKGELLGSWGTTTAAAASELGENWVKVTVSEAPPYSVIFYNTADDTQRAELLLDSAEKVYVTVNAAAFATQAEAEASLNPVTPEPEETYDLYFLNSNGWASVGAYIYGDQGELLGSWGTTTAVAASELGENWVKVTASAAPPYSVIFYNTADDSQRAELLLDAADKVYVTVNAEAFTTKEAAEASVTPVDPEPTDPEPTDPEPTETYELYFLNSNEWESVGAYIYGDKGELLGSWGTTTAVAASELGENWVKVTASEAPPYSVIFYNKADETQRAELLIDASDKVYVTVRAQAFSTKEEAEASMAPVEMHDVYFLNSKNWETVGAYIYGDQGELLGSWGTTTAVTASELGGKWLKVSVPGEPPYSVIFYNKGDETQRAELLLESADKIYVTVNSRAYSSQKAAENSLVWVPAPEPPKPYTLYFLNSEGWNVVGAYIYGDKGELLGAWGNTTAVAAPEIGEKWMKVAVSAEPPYSVIFYNAADDTQRAELFVDAADKIYVTVRAQAFTTKEDAEKAMEPGEEYEIYFLNSSGWAEVGAYIYGEKGELLGSWGSTDAVPAPELGEDWMKVTVTALPPYSVIFYNKADETQRAELLLDAADKLYVTAGNEAFTTQADAEAAAGVTAAIDPNSRDYGPGVEVIETMEGKPVQAEQPKNSVSWLIPVGGVGVAALAGVVWFLLKKKKAA